MRLEIAVALLASAALHAGVLLYTPARFDARTDAAPAAANPGVVIVAHLKNTLDAANETRAPGTTATGTADGPGQRRPRVDNALQFYPPAAIARGIQGETILLLRYKADGSLLDAKVAHSSGHPILDEAALRAVRATPRINDGTREVLFPVSFALQ
jgi:TonB family protein